MYFTFRSFVFVQPIIVISMKTVFVKFQKNVIQYLRLFGKLENMQNWSDFLGLKFWLKFFWKKNGGLTKIS